MLLKYNELVIKWSLILKELLDEKLEGDQTLLE
jgi:hypothetical protein